MQAPMAAEIKEGDHLRFTFPNGLRDECEVTAVKAHTDEGVVLYSDFIQYPDGRIVPQFLRAIRLDWLTHYNRKRIAGSSQEKKQRVDSAAETSEAKQFGFRSGGENDMAETKTRKSLDDMSESHRQHIEKWEPHLDNLRGEHVWAAVMRVPGRGVSGPCYVAVKRGSKDYAIVDYDTEKQPNVTPKRVLSDGFESSTALMEAFKEYRQMARDERAAAKPAAKTAKAPTRKKAPAKKAAAKKTTKKPAAKKAAARKPRKATAKK